MRTRPRFITFEGFRSGRLARLSAVLSTSGTIDTSGPGAAQTLREVASARNTIRMVHPRKTFQLRYENQDASRRFA